jgi:hypothetical protein
VVVSTNKSVPIIISFVLVHIAINCGKLGLIFFVCDKRSTTTLQKTKISHPMIFSVELNLIRFTWQDIFKALKELPPILQGRVVALTEGF